MVASFSRGSCSAGRVFQPSSWSDDDSCVILLEQRNLPAEERYLAFSDVGDVATVIREMVVRGASSDRRDRRLRPGAGGEGGNG
ncbi:MAG: hypothetical protein R3B07_29025 [Polyangiaceae bacterium]